MSVCTCPICQREYEYNPKTCACGFEGLTYPLCDAQGRPTKEFEREELFRVFQFTKRVFRREILYPVSHPSERDDENEVFLDFVSSRQGLVVVDNVGGAGKPVTVADAGLLAFQTNVKALIINVNCLHSEILDESRVQVLFLGANVESLRNGFLIPRSPLRYICVDSKNPYFHAENHVLFDKDMELLICYAPDRPEEEYRVPSSVKVLGKYSFFCPRHLKRLYLPRGVRQEDGACCFLDGAEPEIIMY